MRAERLRSATGSALLLMPAAVLIVVVLGGIAVDRAVVFGAQRDLVATAQAAANDAASEGVDLRALRSGGDVAVARDRIDIAVARAVALADGTVRARWALQDDVLVVRLERTVDLVFSGGVPGASDRQVVRATARSRLLRR
ncbi:MAG TPA: hypothetical protein VHK88_01980 [Aquihabitans sp.]|nr:hypothetical protein [Aquihabitans sp.]